MINDYSKNKKNQENLKAFNSIEKGIPRINTLAFLSKRQVYLLNKSSQLSHKTQTKTRKIRESLNNSALVVIQCLDQKEH